MKKILLSLVCLIAGWQFAFAEEPALYDIVREKLDSVFYYVNKEAVPTGLLAEYGFHLVQLDSYDGVPTDSNYVSRMKWEMLYAGIYDSRINTKCQMPTPDDVYKQAEGNLSIMYYKYNTFAEDALERGLVTFEDEKIRIVQGQPSPYVERECFAVVPEEGSLPLAFDKNNFFTNTGLDVAMVEYKIDNGSYRAIPFSGGAVRVPTGTSPGEYDITFRVTFSNGKVMESHSIVIVKSESSGPARRPENPDIKTFCTIDADNEQSGATVFVKYMNAESTDSTFIRPLIIVEDMDLSSLSNGLSMDFDTILSMDGIDELSKIFDIIYVDFNDGLDDISRNGACLRKILLEINKHRFQTYSDESYIVGLGTGGLIAKLAVYLLESGNIDYKIKKIIAVNSPFRGINIPPSLQSFIKQGYYLGKSISFWYGGLEKIFAPYVSLIDSELMQQLLIYKTWNDSMQEYNLFLNNHLGLRYSPKNCETIVISNGNYRNYTLCSPNQQSIYIESTIYPVGGKAFGLGADIGIRGYTMPDRKSEEVYYGAMRVFATFLWSKTHIAKSYRSVTTTDTMYPIDGTSGTYLETKFINDMVHSEIPELGEIMKVDKFCFVPTFSALDLDADKYFAADDLEDLRGEMNADRAYWTGTNSNYMDFSGIVDILMQELAPTIKGETRNVLGDIVLTADNFIDISLGIRYDWKFRNGKFKVVSQNGAEAVVRPLEYSGAKDYVSVTATPTVDIPGLSGMKVTFPEREITSEKIEIEGLESISRMDNYYALSALPSDGCTVDWTCSSGLRVEKAMEEAALAHVEEFSDDAWIEATLHHGDTDYKFHKDLICARIDSIRFSLEQKVWNRTSKSYKYGFRIKLYPEDIDLELIDFCWGNSVHIYNKSDGSRVDSARPGSMLRGSYGGIASIKTDGDVAPCVRAEKLDSLYHRTDTVIIGILNPSLPGFGDDHSGVHPTSVVEPGGDPIGLDDIVMYGKNCAVVTMPGVSSEEYAAGDIICDITDDFGTKYHVTYTMHSSWTPTYSCSVSPNPAGERLEVRMTVEGDPAAVTVDAPVTALLYSGTGLVAKETFADIRSGGSLDVSHLPEGTYYLNIEVNGTVVDRQVVLIQR